MGCLDSWDEGTRKAAADGLQGIGAAHGPQLLVEALPDASAKERSALVDILLRLRDARAVLPVIQVAGHASAEVRQDAAYALNRMGDIRVRNAHQAAGRPGRGCPRERRRGAWEIAGPPCDGATHQGIGRRGWERPADRR